MLDARLIMLEGLPGTGKSTKSFFLYMQLERSGKQVKWIHEVAKPHPTVFFNEASLSYDEYKAFLTKYPEAKSTLDQVAIFRNNSVGIDLLELEWNYEGNIKESALLELREFDVWTFPLENYKEVAIEKWTYFVEHVLAEKNTMYILDSSIFQYQIFRFLLKNMPYEDLALFIQKLIELIKPLNPVLFYLYRERTEDSLSFLKNLRGEKEMEKIWDRDKAEPYYKDKPEGVLGFSQFLNDYANTAKKLFEDVDSKKLLIELTDNDWTRTENEILTFLGLERKLPPKTLPLDGTYKNKLLGYQFDINGLSIKAPNGRVRKLIPKNNVEFYVECLPSVIRFEESDQIVMTGGQICDKWTTLGTVYKLVSPDVI